MSDEIRSRRKLEEQTPPKEKTYDEKVKNRLEYLEYYKSKVSEGFIKDFKNIMWMFLDENKLLEGLTHDKEIVEKERIKKQNQFIDFTFEDEEELKRYSIMKNFFESNKDFNFNQYKLI